MTVHLRATALPWVAALTFVAVSHLICGVASGAPPDRVPAQPIVERLLNRLGDAAGFEARFVQTNRWAAFDEADTARGTLTVAPPDRFRFQYAEPPGHLVGSDSRHVYTFIPEDRQVLRAAAHHTTGVGELFWDGLGQAADSLARVELRPDGERCAWVNLQPRPEWGLQELEVAITLPEAVPAAYRYVDEEGNEVRFDLHAWRTLERVPDATFHFAVPEGYERLDVD